MHMNEGGENMCKCSHHRVTGVLVVLFGLLFLGGNLGWWEGGVVNMVWPVLVIVGGASKLMAGRCKCC